MIIGFDAKRAAQNRTGLGNYSRFVIRSLSETFPDSRFLMYVPNERRTEYLGEIPPSDNLGVVFPVKALWRRMRSLWRVWGMSGALKADGVNIFHGLSNELPLTIRRASCKSVVTIHDLIFLSHPHCYHFIDRKIYDFKFRRACVNADRIIAVSHYTKRQIVERSGVAADKIDVVHPGADPGVAVPVPQSRLIDVARRHALPEQFLLYVGSIEERKNLLLAVEAVARLAARGERVHLVAVGHRTSYLDKIERRVAEEGIEDLFHVYHGVGYTDLPSFYRLASAFVYPSRVEGFGIPLLEAITAGVPAIGCTGSCLEEAGGPSSLYVSPDDVEAMSAAISRIMSDDALRCAMISEGLSYSRRFAAPTLAQDLMAVYQKVMNQS